MKERNDPISRYMTPQPHTIGYDIPLQRAREIMRRFQVRHLPVLKGGKLVGILSERNVQAAAMWRNSESLVVEDVMIPDVFVVPEDEPVGEVARVMAEEKIGSVIVASVSGNVVGVFTTTDACRLLHRVITEDRAA